MGGIVIQRVVREQLDDSVDVDGVPGLHEAAEEGPIPFSLARGVRRRAEAPRPVKVGPRPL